MQDIQNIPTTQYIGPRIIPHLWDPILWDASTQYDALAVVQYNGAGYVARYVPPQGTVPTNTEYWVRWSDFNAQLAQVQQQVTALAASIDSKVDDTELQQAVDTINGKIDVINENIQSSAGEISELNAHTNYLDAKTDLTSESAFNCVGRFILGTDNDSSQPFYGRSALQSNCVITRDGIDYWCAITGPDKANHFIVQRLTDGAIICDKILNLGHGNIITENGTDKLLVSDYATNSLIVVDVSSLSSPYIETNIEVNLPDGLSVVSASYVGNSGKVIIVSGNSLNARNAKHAYIYSDYNLTSLEKSVTFSSRFNSDWSHGFQGAYCDGKYLMFVSSNVEMVTFIDIEDGDVAFTWLPNLRYGHILITELESFFVHNGAYYMSNFNVSGFELYPSSDRLKETLIRTADLLKFDPKSNENGNYVSTEELKNYINNIRYQNPIDNPDLLFEGLLHKPNSNRPFMLISDAVQYCIYLGIPVCIFVMPNNNVAFGLYPSNQSINIILNAGCSMPGGFFELCNVKIEFKGNNIISGYRNDENSIRGLTFYNSNVIVEGINNVSTAAKISSGFGFWTNNCMLLADKTTWPSTIDHGSVNGLLTNIN